MQLLKAIYDIAAVMVLFGAAIFVHEFGHYWMARKRGLKVEGFAIGFGPKIFGWTKDGIDYAWRWIPAGGFVKLPQMTTSTAIEGQSDGAEKLPPVTPWSKILVAFAGPFMNVVFAFALATVIYIVGLPVPINPPIIGYVEPGSAEAKFGIQEGDEITRVDGKQVKSWEDVQSFTVLARTNVVPVEIERKGVTNNYLLTAKVSEVLGLKVLNLDSRDHPVIIDVLKGGAADEAGLKAKDEVVSVGGVPVLGQDHFVKMIRARASQKTDLVVRRDDKKVTLLVTPRVDPTTKQGFIGAHLTDSGRIMYRVQKPGPTPWASVTEVVDRTVATFSALAHSRQTGVGAKDLSGPVGILTMLAAWVNTDYRLALNFLVLLNVNLAMLNLLPLPVLDGGHIAMSILEWVRRRPLSARFVEYATTVFALLLISFMLYVTFFDFKRMPLFRSMFSREMQVEQPDKGGDSSPPAPATETAPKQP